MYKLYNNKKILKKNYRANHINVQSFPKNVHTFPRNALNFPPNVRIFSIRFHLVRVKVFLENILFFENAIFRKGKCFHVFGCISKNVSKNIF